MGKVLIYTMEGQKMCFLHGLMNALDLAESGAEVKIVLEGQSVKLPKELTEEKNPMYQKALDKGLVAGVCKGCSKVLGVMEENEKLGLPLLDDMFGQAGTKPYIEDGYQVLIF